MRSARVAKLGVLLLPLVLATPARGADKQVNIIDQAASTASLFSFNYGPPTSSAVDLLGFSSSKMAPASSLGPFVLSVPSLWAGGAGQFAGLDVSPVWLLKSPTFASYSVYQSNYFNEEVLRLRADFGLTNGATASDPAKQQLSGFAAGFSLPLLPNDDPLKVGLKGLGSGSEYFRQCLGFYKGAFIDYEASAASYWAGHVYETSWALNEWQRTNHNTATVEERRAFLEYLRKHYSGVEPGLPATAGVPDFDEGDLLSRTRAWALANQDDPMAAPLQTASELLAKVDGVSTKDMNGAGLTKAETLSRLQAFLNTQPDLKPGVKPLRDWLARSGVAAAAGVPLPLDSDVASMSGDDLTKRINLYTKNVGDAHDKAQKAEDDFSAAQAKVQGITDLVTGCAKGASVLATAQPDISVGLGFRESGDPGYLRNLRYSGESVWLSGRVPLASWVETGGKAVTLDKATISAINNGNLSYLMLGGSGRYDSRAFFTTGDKTTPVIQADKLDAWIGVEGYFTWARLGAQVGYSSIRAVDPINAQFNQHGVRWLTEAAFKLGSTGTWLGGTYGTANGTTTKLNDKTFLLTVYFSPPSADALFGNGVK